MQATSKLSELQRKFGQVVMMGPRAIVQALCRYSAAAAAVLCHLARDALVVGAGKCSLGAWIRAQPLVELLSQNSERLGDPPQGVSPSGNDGTAR